MKLDLTKLVLSGNIPVGFRELTAEEFPSPGDIYRTEGNSTTGWLERTVQHGVAYIQYKRTRDGAPVVFWLPHFRRIENPAHVPATHGQVTAGKTERGDLVYCTGSHDHPYVCSGGSDISTMSNAVYRIQPAFVVEPAVKKAERCHYLYVGKVEIPPGFRELDENETRAATDFVWGLDTDNAWETVAPHTTLIYSRYDASSNPTIRRTEPVSDKAPLLPGEKVENVTQRIATEMFCSVAAIDYKSKFENVSAELAEQDKLIGNLTSQANRERAAAEVWVKKLREAETSLTAQKAANGILKSTIAGRNEAIDRIEASCNIRVNNLWQANVDLQAERNVLQYDLDRQNLALTDLRDQKKLLEVKLKDSEAVAEQRRTRIAALECSLLKIKQEAANATARCSSAPAGYRRLGPFDYPIRGDVFQTEGYAFDPRATVVNNYNWTVAHHQTLVSKPTAFFRPT